MYILEGNIGAGKSTFLTYIAQAIPSIEIALEPVDSWQKNFFGQSLLANFYQDPKRWAYTLETFAMACRVREHKKDQENPNPNLLIERSIYSGHYCFVLNGYEQGYMTPLEWHLYNEWFSMLIPTCKPPRGFIYLQTDPKIAYERIKKRNRLGETNISFEYIQQIHDHHETFLIKKHNVVHELAQVPVLVLNCDQDFEENENIRHKLFDRLVNFISI